MLIATARAPQPGNEKGRPARRPISVFSNSTTANSAAVLRLQCLERAGILGMRASLIAQLAWGDGCNDRAGGVQ